MDHHFRCGAEGNAEGFEDKYTYISNFCDYF
jgi:hypothetical protein